VLQSVSVAEGGSAAPPSAPAREGYTFTGWDRGQESWTNVQADAVIKAQYAAEDETVVTTPGGTEITDNPAPLSGVSGSNGIGALAGEQGIPVIGVPLFAPDSENGAAYETFAMLNIMIVGIGALLALSFCIIWMRKGRREARIRIGAKHKGIGWLTAAVALAALNIIVAIPTQDTTLAAVWADKWTALSLIMLAAGAAAGALSLKAPKQPAATSSFLP
jgi:hypothetical protein